MIPALWEDNLQQVAIEMVAFGVPILSSSAGGASELTRSDAFRFNVGDTEDFLKKIYAIVDQEVSLDEFWKNHSGLCTNQEHYEQIEKVYALGKVIFLFLEKKCRRFWKKKTFYISILSKMMLMYIERKSRG